MWVCMMMAGGYCTKFFSKCSNIMANSIIKTLPPVRSNNDFLAWQKFAQGVCIPTCIPSNIAINLYLRTTKHETLLTKICSKCTHSDLCTLQYTIYVTMDCGMSILWMSRYFWSSWLLQVQSTFALRQLSIHTMNASKPGWWAAYKNFLMHSNPL